MAPPVLILRDIALSFGGTSLFESADLVVSAGDRLCLVGRNGSGKSTLLRIAAGEVEADGGERYVEPGITIRYLPQEPDLTGHSTTHAVVAAGLAPGDDPHRARSLLERLGLTGNEDPRLLSGGEARRCALALALAPQPDILLLDEPTNHLDLPAIEWLEAELGAMRSAMVLVSHDRRFLETLSRGTVWIDHGRTHRLDRGFAAFEPWRDDMMEKRARDRVRLDRKIETETEWLHKGVTARRKRNQGRLRALHALREDRRTQRRSTGNVAMTRSKGAMSGRLVIEADGISKSWAAAAPVVRDFSLRVMRGDRVGIVGPNGAGKTTLLNLLTGVLDPDGGAIRLGANLQMVTLDQTRKNLDAQRTLADTLTGGGGDSVTVAGTQRHVISYMKDFLFLPEQARTPVGVLSGGERGRLLLACALARPSNLLVLDEPTNDLDIETLDLLQEMLADYPGTVLLVSHDRDFLDRVVTSVIANVGEGAWQDYAGGYSDMVVQRAAGATATTAAPPPARRKKAPAPRPANTKKRLSFKDKHALEALPARIEDLQAEIESGRSTLADAGLYARDAVLFARTAAALSQAEAALGDAEEQWLALELKREEIEGA